MSLRNSITDKNTVEQYERHPQRKELTSNQKKVMGIIGAALALSAVGYGIKANADNKAEIRAAVAANEQIADSPEQEAVANLLEQYGDGMEQYEEMGIDEFNKLPLDTRLDYAMFLIDKTNYGGDYKLHYTYGSGNELATEYTTVSKDNTGQEIDDDNSHIRQIAALQETQDKTGESQVDNVAAIKVLSAVYYRVDDKPSLVTLDYLDLKDKLLSRDKISSLDCADVVDNTKTSELKSGVDRENNRVEYKIVVLRDGDGDIHYSRFIYHEFINYDGKKSAVWLLDVNEDSADELNAQPIN